jgi:hypothetical protein
MVRQLHLNTFFKKFTASWQDGDRPVVGKTATITTLVERPNRGALPRKEKGR